MTQSGGGEERERNKRENGIKWSGGERSTEKTGKLGKLETRKSEEMEMCVERKKAKEK